MAVTAYTTWRNARIDALAHAALDKKPDATAVKRLAGYSGQRASELLLVVASGAQTASEPPGCAASAGRPQGRSPGVAVVGVAASTGESRHAAGAGQRHLSDRMLGGVCAQHSVFRGAHVARRSTGGRDRGRFRRRACRRRNRNYKRRWMKSCARTSRRWVWYWSEVYGLAGLVSQSVRDGDRDAPGDHRSVPAADAHLSDGTREREGVAGV